MSSLVNGGFPTCLGFHLLNTEERGPEPPLERAGPTGLGLSWPGFGPIFSTLHVLHFGSLGSSIVGFGRRYLRDQVKGS
jgi:hypothetical protein